MCSLYQSRALELGGNPCQETGGKIGKAIPISMGRPSHLGSLVVMEGLSPASMLPLLIGNLGRLMREANSNFTNEINNFRNLIKKKNKFDLYMSFKVDELVWEEFFS